MKASLTRKYFLLETFHQWSGQTKTGEMIWIIFSILPSVDRLNQIFIWTFWALDGLTWTLPLEMFQVFPINNWNQLVHWLTKMNVNSVWWRWWWRCWVLLSVSVSGRGIVLTPAGALIEANYFGRAGGQSSAWGRDWRSSWSWALESGLTSWELSGSNMTFWQENYAFIKEVYDTR